MLGKRIETIGDGEVARHWTSAARLTSSCRCNWVFFSLPTRKLLSRFGISFLVFCWSSLFIERPSFNYKSCYDIFFFAFTKRCLGVPDNFILHHIFAYTIVRWDVKISILSNYFDLLRGDIMWYASASESRCSIRHWRFVGQFRVALRIWTWQQMRREWNFSLGLCQVVLYYLCSHVLCWMSGPLSLSSRRLFLSTFFSFLVPHINECLRVQQVFLRLAIPRAHLSPV